MPHSYTWGGRMQLSTCASADVAIRTILTANIPGAVDAERAKTSEDRRGTDWWVDVIQHGDERHRVSVDVKVRDKDFALQGRDDLALETWSVLNETPGWTRDPRKRTDYVLWWWKQTGRWCLVPFSLLCAVFSERWEGWSKTYGTHVQETPPDGTFAHGWQSQCVFVPRRIVWRAIYEKFGGEAAA